VLLRVARLVGRLAGSIARLLGRTARGVGREIAATLRWGAPALAASAAADGRNETGPEHLGVVVGITELSRQDPLEPPSSD
jgi:hypothetical protein